MRQSRMVQDAEEGEAKKDGIRRGLMRQIPGSIYAAIRALTIPVSIALLF